MLRLEKQYKGLGFVEALIALMVCGVVSVVLMRISASTLRDLYQLDVQDAVARHAVSTAVHLQQIAIKDKTAESPDDTVFGNLIINNCYGFNEQNEVSEDTYQVDIREGYMNESLVEEGSEYFRIFCVKSNPNDKQKVLVQIIVGSNKMYGKATSDRDVKDYSYYAIIKK